MIALAEDIYEYLRELSWIGAGKLGVRDHCGEKWFRAAWGVGGPMASPALTDFLRETAPKLPCPRQNSSRETGMRQSLIEVLELKLSPLENMPTSHFFLGRKNGGADTQLL